MRVSSGWSQVGSLSDGPDLAVRQSAMVSVAIGFDTWQALVRRSGLSDMEEADLMARAVVCVGGPDDG